MILSVLLPAYNSISKVPACLQSLAELHEHLPGNMEAIAVDDHSADGTFSYLQSQQAEHNWLTLVRLDQNSGTPAVPRNEALLHATGQFVCYLDSDDEIIPHGILSALTAASTTGSEIVRSPLIRFDGQRQLVMNNIPSWGDELSQQEKKELIVRRTSPTPPAIYRRDFLLERNLQWPRHLVLGEDAIFLYEALLFGRVEFDPEPIYIYNVESLPDSQSATHKYEEVQLRSHLRVWERSEEILAELGLNYLEMRGAVSLNTAFSAMIKFNRSGISKDTFDDLAGFLIRRREVVSGLKLIEQARQVLELVLERDYAGFSEVIST